MSRQSSHIAETISLRATGVSRRIFLHSFVLLLASGDTFSAAPALGQGTYPTQPIRLVVPYAAGGSSDVIARTLAHEASRFLPQQVVVDNRPGANGMIGVTSVVRAPPDGYTVLFGGLGSTLTNVFLLKEAPDPRKTLVPITLLGEGGMALVVHPSLPVKSLTELIDYGKANPGKLKGGSAGHGSIPHIALEMFKAVTGLDITSVPYKGGGPALTALVGGEIDLLFDVLTVTAKQIETGAVRGLAVTTAERAPALPDLPTVGEALQGYEVGVWSALFAPIGTSPEIVATLNKAFRSALDSPGAHEKLGSVYSLIGSTPEELQGRVDENLERYGEVMRSVGIEPQ